MSIDQQADAHIFDQDFGEELVYHPYNGPARLITGSVFREVPEPLETGNTPTVVMAVSVPNSSEQGISRDELDLGRDQIEVAVKVGGEKVFRKLAVVEDEDPGRLTIGVR